MTRRRIGMLALVAAGAAYAWVASGLTDFSWPVEAMAFLPGFAVCLVCARRPAAAPAPGIGAGRPAAPDRRGLLAWAAVLGLLLTLELVEYFAGARAAHPTVSSLAAPLLRHREFRLLAWAGWLALGLGVARW